MALPIIAAGALTPFLAAFGKFLLAYAIARVITALAITLVTYTAFDQFTNYINSQLNSLVYSVSGDVAVMAEALGFIDGVQMLMSAYVAAIAIRSAMGAYRRVTFGGLPGGL